MPDLLVHPTEGLDTNPGTYDRPLQTAAKALNLLADQPGSVLLLPGQHGVLTDGRRRTNGPLRVVSMPGATLAGINSRGATDLTFHQATIRGGFVDLDYASSGDRLGRPSERIAFTGTLDISNPGDKCLRIYNRAQDIDIAHAHLHDSAVGYVAPGRVDARYISERIRFGRLDIARMDSDGVQVTFTRGLRIEGGTLEGAMADQTDPDLHPDGIQLAGHVYDAEIRNVVARGWRTQAIIAQTDLGPSRGLVIEDCDLGDTYGIAVQVLGVAGAVVRHNTITGSKDGALRFGPGRQGAAPTDAVAEGNVLHSRLGRALTYVNGARPASPDYQNVVLPA